MFYPDVSGIDKILINLEEAGRSCYRNISEKSANEYKISAETTLAQEYAPEVIIRQAEAKRADLIVVG
ncbi:MAG: hypothetical protein ACJ70S_04870, partial [Nitrososphaera sp.]